MREREQWIDLLRIISCFAVVLLHVSVYGVYNETINAVWYAGNFYDSVSRFAVPCFFMISGMLYKEDSKKNYEKIRKLFLLYLFWTFVYVVFINMNCIFEGDAITLVKVFFKQIIFSYNHLWYIPALIIVWICAPLVNLKERLLVVAFCLLLSLGTIEHVFLEKTVINAIYWNISNTLWCLGYFVLGKWAYNHIWTKQDRIIVYIGGIMSTFIICVGTFLLKWNESNSVFGLYEYDTLFVGSVSIAIFVFVKTMFEKRPSSKLVKEIANCTFGIYLVHILIRDMLWKVADKVPTMMINIWGIPILAFVIFLLSFIVVYICRRISILKVMFVL